MASEFLGFYLAVWAALGGMDYSPTLIEPELRLRGPFASIEECREKKGYSDSECFVWIRKVSFIHAQVPYYLYIPSSR